MECGGNNLVTYSYRSLQQLIQCLTAHYDTTLLTEVLEGVLSTSDIEHVIQEKYLLKDMVTNIHIVFKMYKQLYHTFDYIKEQYFSF